MPTKQIEAGPTKAFFVRMLTRDIELADAILDLLDNCVDGVLRQIAKSKKRPDAKKPYDGYWAKITLSPEKFEILDNCGGIPEDVAEKSAFMLGRPDRERDAGLETVGVYGIGMKRAIFKMGRNCVVTSQPDTGPYKVEITPDWLDQDGNWTLPLTQIKAKLPEDGTRIVVTDLHEAVGRQFDERKSAFISDLTKEISRLYALIIEKGFKVYVNSKKEIQPVDLVILRPKELAKSRGPQIEPYVFVGDFEGVHVDLAVGFCRPLAKETEMDDDVLVRRSREEAGWTVMCNDRVVLYNDKTAKTGWGTGGVPGYHNQFISIAGVVSFRSTDSMKLPLNTTKRGLDASSEVYLIVLDYMREGLKKFTSFTNAWKRHEEETDEAFAKLQKGKPTDVSGAIPPAKFSEIRKHKDKGTGRYYSPDLPKPEQKHPMRRISFAALEEDIAMVAAYYFGDRNTDRGVVGKKCFDESLAQAKEQLQ